MKNFKRKLAGFLIFAMVLGIMAPGVVAPTTVKADDVNDVGVVVDYERENITFSNVPTSVAAIRYTDAEQKKIDDGKATWENAEKVKMYGDERIAIDLSWVKKTKDVTLSYQMLDKKDKVISHGAVTLAKQTTEKYKVALITVPSGSSVKVGRTTVNVPDKYAVGSADTGWIVVYDSKNTAVSPATIRVRKGTTAQEGIPMTELGDMLPKLKAKGATLYFQVFYPAKDDSMGGDGHGIAWPSKTIKFSYKKQANAPKVKLDLKKDTIALKTGMEYRPDGATTWTRVPENTKNMAISKVLEVSGSAVTMAGIYNGEPTKVEVRTVKDGAVPSKIAKVQIKASTIEAINAASNVGITYNVDKAQYEFTNKDDVPYEYTTVASSATITFAANQKWNAIKVPKADKKDAPVTSLKESKLQPGYIIVVRKAAQKATKATSTAPAKEELLASKYERQDPASIKNNSTRAVSYASVTANVPEMTTKGAVVADTTKVNVSGTAISGKAVTLTVNVVVTNAKGAKVTLVTKKVNDATVKTTTTTVGDDGKVVVTIDIPADKQATSGDIKFKVGVTEFTINVDIKAGS